jgi:integrase
MKNFSPCDYSDAGQPLNTPIEADILRSSIENMTLKAFRAEYEELIKQSKSPNYLASVKISLKFLVEDVGDIPLRSLDKRTLEKFLSKTFARSKQVATLFYRTIKAALTKANEWEYITENPLRKFKMPKVANPFPVFISHSELMKIIEKVTREELKNIYLLAYYTGMRRAEIINLRWENIDLEKGIIAVSNGNGFTTKSKKDRIIPICTPLLEILKKLHEDKANDVYVFTTKEGAKFYDDLVGKQFKKAVRAAELNEKIHFHSLRHSFASALVQNGVSIYVVKELLGHEDIRTTEIYSHLQNESLVKALTIFNASPLFR